jgi:hypothetical protein
LVTELPENNDIHVSGTAGFEKTDISPLGSYCGYLYLSEDTTRSVLVEDVAYTNYYNFNKINTATLKILVILFVRTGLKGSHFWKWNVQVH